MSEIYKIHGPIVNKFLSCFDLINIKYVHRTKEPVSYLHVRYHVNMEKMVS